MLFTSQLAAVKATEEECMQKDLPWQIHSA